MTGARQDDGADPRTVLACDTSTRTASVALLRGGVVLAEWTSLSPAGRSTHLLADVVAILERQGLSPADVDLFVTSLGPGAFTGIRVGMATCKGLAYATGRPLAGVLTLETLAHALLRPGGPPVLATLDARRGEVYGALYGPDGDVLLAPAVREAGGLAAAVAEAVPAGVVVAAGDGVVAYRAAFEAALGSRLVVAPPEHHVIRASVLARLGASRPAAPVAEVEPIYLRRPEAEVRASGG